MKVIGAYTTRIFNKFAHKEALLYSDDGLSAVSNSVLPDDIATILYTFGTTGKLAKYKFPRYIEIIQSFPLTSNGKIKRNILK